MSIRKVLAWLVLFGLLVGCSTAVPTDAPSSPSAPPSTEAAEEGNFIDHAFLPPESQVVFQGDSFYPLELSLLLLTGFGEPDQVEWQVGPSEHLALVIEDGQLIAEPLEPDWIGQEAIELTACNMQEEYCTRGQVDYGVLDPAQPTIIHVQNDGYLIMVGGKKILIDGLFILSANPPSPQRLQAMQEALPPFNDIDLILITHDHADHFEPDLVGEHLLNDTQAVVVTTDVTAEYLASWFEDADQFEERVTGLHLEAGQTQTIEAAGIELEIYYLSHGNPTMPNFGFLFTLEGMTFFHTGDIVVDDIPLEEVQEFGLHERGIDIGFMPHFYLWQDEYEGYIESAFAPVFIIPIHVDLTGALTPRVVMEMVTEADNMFFFEREMSWWVIDIDPVE
jgi:L-ascorbate metabolism protein UlaG (beta-lactamase superfamily)